VLATTVPNIQAYDPAWAYEIAVIIQHGLRRMYHDQEDVFYYITLQNEAYAMPPMPGLGGGDGAASATVDGILRGLYLYQPAPALKGAARKKALHAQLLGSGSILQEVLRAQEILAERYDVQADVWSATSYNQLRRDALDCERWNMMHPDEPQRTPYVTTLLAGTRGPIVGASDYMKSVPDQIARWTGRGIYSLGTDGFGRSDTREALRRFFEVDAECIVISTLNELAREGAIKRAVVKQAITDLGLDPEKPYPLTY